MVMFSYMKIPVAVTCVFFTEAMEQDRDVTILNPREPADVNGVVSIADTVAEIKKDRLKRADPQSPAFKELVDSTVASNKDVKDEAGNTVLKYIRDHDKAFGFAGVGATTAGTIWAFNRLSEALDDLQTGPADVISEGYCVGFLLLLSVGPALLAYIISSKFAPESMKMVAFGAGIAGLLFGGGIIAQSADIAALSITLWVVSGIVLTCIVYWVFFGAHKKRDVDPISTTVIAANALGFVSLIGGFSLLSFSVTEELADTGDSLGGETGLIWFALAIGFTWLIKLFMAPKGGRDGMGFVQSLTQPKNIAIFLIAGATAGCLAGGLECAITSSWVGAIFCFAGFIGMIIVTIVFKFKRTGCFGKAGNFLFKQNE